MEWCSCDRCREMPKDKERICCGGGSESCVSRLADMDLYILDPGTLQFVRLYRNDVLAFQDEQEHGVDHREFRHAAYRDFVLWQFGRLGEGNGVAIPSCCVWRIWDTFPDPHGHYTGFIPNRL
ncbi:P2X purinoceptor 7-like [Branchiostoma lanceolatum]|uniref:P2X purinoceptor 7-like n=1 Tax=Branchiostoma lanceolatum TaxID=7740 RepID=UPI0034560E40